MARPTHGSHIRITPLDFKEIRTVKGEDGKEVEQIVPMENPPWAEHEWVKCRTLYSAEDREWIYAHSVITIVDSTQPNGVRVEANDIAAASATVARMVLAWRLDKQIIDKVTGDPMVHDNGSYIMQENALPDKLEPRLQAVRDLHEADMLFIYTKIQEGTPAPLREEEKKTFLISASAPTQETSNKEK